MALFKRTTKDLILKIDEFFDNVDIGLLVFREGVKAYLGNDMEAFNRHILKVELLESNADKLQRSIENEMITHSILPQHRGEVSALIDVLDEIIDTVKSTLNEFGNEMPDIPASLNHNFLSVMEASVSAGEELIPAARAYFKSPYTVREKLLKVYYFESETDKISRSVTRIIFQEMKELDLAHKSHLRYIIHHIEKISDNAQKAADLLSADGNKDRDVKMILLFLTSGLFLGWSLGANDAANVFGSAVGSRMVSFRKAAIIASVFVILGAVIQGAGAAGTLGKLGAVNAVGGSFTVALAAAVTVYLMTKFALPVSTTQAIVGAIIGWNLFTGNQTDGRALTQIVTTWISGPVIGAVFAIILYMVVKSNQKEFIIASDKV